MREAVTVKFGGRDYSLLPSFAVADAFEDRFGSLAAHLANLMGLTASMSARAFLICEAMKAADDEIEPPDGQSRKARNFALDATKKAMFDVGYWHEDLVIVEIELVEKMLYTPEQYIAKKAMRAEAEKAQADAIASLDALSNYSLSQPQT